MAESGRSPARLWTTAKCHRVLRPLSSKLHSLRNLIGSHPSLVGGGQDTAGTAEYGERQRTASGRLRRYSAKSQSSRRAVQTAKDECAPADGAYRTDAMLIALRGKVSADIYAAYRSILYAFHHFMTMTYECPRTLAQRSALEIGKCVVYTLGSVSEDEWYESVEVLKYYRRFIVIGHGVSLISRDAAFYADLLPLLIVDCADLEAYDMGVLLLRSLLEVTPVDAVLSQAELFISLCNLVKTSPFLLLQYVVPTLTLSQFTSGSLLTIISKLQDSCTYGSLASSASYKDMICHIFAFCRRQLRRSSSLEFEKVEQTLFRLTCIVCRSFDGVIIQRLVKVMGPARARFADIWQLLCVHSALFGFVDDEFIQSGPLLRARLRAALVEIYAGDAEKARVLVENLLHRVPRFAATLAGAFAGLILDTKWREEVGRQAISMTSEGNWRYDESLEEWVSFAEDRSSSVDHTDYASASEADPVDEQLALSTASEKVSSLLYILPPPSSVSRLTPRSSMRVRQKYFKLLSTPATAVSDKRAWFDRTDDDDSDSEADTTASPLQRKQASKELSLVVDEEEDEDEPVMARRRKPLTDLTGNDCRRPHKMRKTESFSERLRATTGEKDDDFDEPC